MLSNQPAWGAMQLFCRLPCCVQWLQRSLKTGDPWNHPLRSFAASRCIPMPRLTSLPRASLTPLGGEGPAMGHGNGCSLALPVCCTNPTEQGQFIQMALERSPELPGGALIISNGICLRASAIPDFSSLGNAQFLQTSWK